MPVKMSYLKDIFHVLFVTLIRSRKVLSLFSFVFQFFLLTSNKSFYSTYRIFAFVISDNVLRVF